MKAKGKKMRAITPKPTIVTNGKPRRPQPMAVKKTTAIVINNIFERLHCRLIADVMTAWVFGSF